MRNFASILLVNRLLLCKYSKAVFFVFIASFILKIVQNTDKGDSFLMSKLFLVENDLFPRYKTMSNKRKEIGQLCLHFAHSPTSIVQIFKGSFLCFYCKFYLENCSKYRER